MSNNVFANGRELSCKAGSGKSIAAFPDVCMTPPENPATPPGVPVPYPNTGDTADTTDGSRTVKITGKEVMLKNKSYFKKSMGDEAGAAAKKGVVSSVNRGKVYFTMWSMDVKIEGENAVRHLDMTTHNHGSAGNGPPWPFIDDIAAAQKNKNHPCHEEVKNERAACKGKSDPCDGGACQKARACMFVPYGGSGSPNCCPGHTGDHVVEASSFAASRGGAALPGCKNYDLDAAPTCCVKGGAYSGDHGFMSALRGEANSRCPVATSGPLKGHRQTTYGEARENGARSVRSVHTHCSEECAAAQIDHYHKDECKISDNTKVRAITYGDPMKWIPRLM
jgi:hypothetical protein